MLVNINDNLPEINRARQNFGKRQSQLMDNMLTVHHPTPLRNMRQILSEVERSYSALREGYWKQQKTKIEIQIKYRDAELKGESLESQLLMIEAQELESQLEAGEIYISGAIRKIRNYTEQYNSIAAKVMEEQGVTEFSEIDFEAEEEKYHIMTAFSQGLNAARSKGRIDEGNQIYLQQLGINGHAAENEVQGLLLQERQMLEKGFEPGNDLVLEFLNKMAEKFKGCTQKMQEYKGMNTMTTQACVSPKLIGDE